MRTDEHVAPLLVATVRSLACSQSVELSSVYEAGQHGRADVSWVTAFAAEGGDGILPPTRLLFVRHADGVDAFLLEFRWIGRG